MTRGAALARRCGSAARMQRIWENSFTSMSSCQSSSVSAANRPGRAPPALLTRMSSPPMAAAAAATNVAHLGGVGHVAGQRQRVAALPPGLRLRSSAAAASSSAAFREQIATAAPSASSSAAMALPSPLDPPVTMARRPASPRSTYSSPAALPRSRSLAPRPRRRRLSLGQLEQALRGGQNTSTSRQRVSVVHAPCGTQDGMTATSPLRMVRTSPSRSKVNSPSRTMTICSSSWTCRGAVAPGSKGRSSSCPSGRAPGGTRARAGTPPGSTSPR